MTPIECTTRDGHRAVIVRLYGGKRYYPLEVKVYSKFFFSLIFFRYEYYKTDGQYLNETPQPLDLVSGDKKWLQ